MAFPSETFVNAFTAAMGVVGDELRAFYAQLTGWMSVEHTDTGGHGAVTATSVTSSGAVSGTTGTFTGTLTQGGAGGSMTAVLSSDSVFGPGLTLTIPFGATWRLETLGGATRTLSFRDVLNVGEAGTFEVQGGTIGATTDYTLLPHSAGIHLFLGANTANQRLYETNTLTTRTDRLALRARTAPASITASQNNYAINGLGRVFLTASAAWDITGIVAGTDGEALWLVNGSAFAITLKNASASSSAGNQLVGANAADVILRANNGSALLVYDTTLGYWFVTGP